MPSFQADISEPRMYRDMPSLIYLSTCDIDRQAKQFQIAERQMGVDEDDTWKPSLAHVSDAVPADADGDTPTRSLS